MSCQFLLGNELNELYVYPPLPLNLPTPPTHPSRLSESTELSSLCHMASHKLSICTWHCIYVNPTLSILQKNKYVLTRVYEIQKDGTDEPVCRAGTEMQIQRTDLCTQRGKGSCLRHVLFLLSEVKALWSDLGTVSYTSSFLSSREFTAVFSTEVVHENHSE